MKSIVRLTENELKQILHESIKRALQQKLTIQESIDRDREIRLAQKALCKFPLSDVGLRLEGTQFYNQYEQIKNDIVDLNNSLIDFIRKGK